MVQTSLFLKGELEELGCFFADKSFLLGSTKEVASQIQQRLAAAGVSIEAPQSGRDLGIDVTMGRARRLRTISARTQEARTRMVKAKIATQLCKRATMLTTMGAMPKAEWGRSSMGTSPTQVKSIRVAVAAALRVHRAGGCTTTGFEVMGWRKLDPAFRLPLEAISQVLSMLVVKPEAARAATLVFGRLGTKLGDKEPNKLWHGARGPASSTIATIIQHGWSVVRADRWRDPGGQ